MSQTDRQTDKAIHWNTAVFDVDDNWAKLNTLPDFVKEIHKQKEVCPTTNREHFQIHVVCHRQVRLTQMTGWISKSHWKPVRGAEYIANSLKYTKKSESAVPGTQQVQKGPEYYKLHELLLVVARCWMPMERPDKGQTDRQTDTYNRIVLKILEKELKWPYALKKTVQDLGLEWISKLSNPVLKYMWEICVEELLDAVQKEEGFFIIEEPSHGEIPTEYSFS